jgi:hypothetical protein
MKCEADAIQMATWDAVHHVSPSEPNPGELSLRSESKPPGPPGPPSLDEYEIVALQQPAECGERRSREDCNRRPRASRRVKSLRSRHQAKPKVKHIETKTVRHSRL